MSGVVTCVRGRSQTFKMEGGGFSLAMYLVIFHNK